MLRHGIHAIAARGLAGMEETAEKWLKMAEKRAFRPGWTGAALRVLHGGERRGGHSAARLGALGDRGLPKNEDGMSQP